MGWEDRPYYRDPRPGAGGGPLNWILYGSVPLFTAFGIRVRAHASLVIIIGLILLLGFGGFGDTVAARVQSVLALFLVILLHEFGHCFAARWTGGEANEILMTPLGGLAMAMARRKPWPTFVTVAGGPAVNVIICLLCGLGLYLAIGVAPLTPNQFVGTFKDDIAPDSSLVAVANYLFWIYSISYWLLLFNLLPVYPLDGGQLLQSVLWKPMGYYKSMLLTLNVGLVGAALMMMIGIATIGTLGGGFLLAFIGLNCLMNCYQMKTMMTAEGPWAFSNEDEPDYGGGGGYGSSYGGAAVATRPERKPKGPGWFARKRAEKVARDEVDEQQTIDTILAKVSAQGMHSLTRGEKKALERATENQRKRDQQRTALRKRSLGG